MRIILAPLGGWHGLIGEVRRTYGRLRPRSDAGADLRRVSVRRCSVHGDLLLIAD